MKHALLILAFLALCSSAGATDKIISTPVIVDTTFVQDLFFAGAICHATAATALVVVSDSSGEIWRWSVAVDGNSDGEGPFQGSIPCADKMVVRLTDCQVTLYRRIE